MRVTLSLRGEKKEVEFSGRTLGDLLSSQGINPEEYVFSRNGELILADEPLHDGDEIKLVPVVSGG